MRIEDPEKPTSIVGFDLPAVDNWRMRIRLTIDLFDVQPSVRELLNARILSFYPTFEKFQSVLIEARQKQTATVDPNLTKVLTELTQMLNHLDNDSTLLVEADSEVWGGSKNLHHNQLAMTSAGDVGLVPEEEREYLVREYIDKPQIVNDKLVKGTIVPVPIPDFSVQDPNLSLRIPAVTRFHLSFDERSIVHNDCLKAATLSDVDPDIVKKYNINRSNIGRGIIPRWFGKRIPDPDGGPRVIRWLGSLSLVTNTVMVPQSSLHEVLRKPKVDEIPLKTLFVHCRNMRGVLFAQARVINKLLDSEYAVPEKKVVMQDPIELPDGKMSNEVWIGLVMRPNRRVIGLTDDEISHNKSAKRAGKPLVGDYYFDSSTQQSHQTFTEIPHPTMQGVLVKVAKEIPPHGIDIFDVKIAMEDETENEKRAQAGQPLKSSEDELRPILDSKFEPDWRFIEIVEGIYIPAINAAYKMFVDPRTNKPWWKYRNHASKLSIERMRRKIKVIRSLPPDMLAFKDLFRMMRDAFTREGQSIFSILGEGEVDPYCSSIAFRVPQLALEVIKKENLMLPELEEEANASREEQIFNEKNFNSIKSHYEEAIIAYRNNIDVYPFATISAEPTAGWFYTEPNTPDTLRRLGLGAEDPDINEERRVLEQKLHLLDVCIQLLETDKDAAQPSYFRTKLEPTPKASTSSGPRASTTSPATQKRSAKSEKTLQETMALYLKGDKSNTRQSILALAKSSGLSREWGYPDLANNEGSPSSYINAIFLAISKTTPSWETFANYVMGLKNEVDTISPENLVATYKINTEAAAKKIIEFLMLYYDPLSVVITLTQVDGKQVIMIQRAADVYVYEIMSKYFQNATPEQIEAVIAGKEPTDFIEDLKHRNIVPAPTTDQITNTLRRIKEEVRSLAKAPEPKPQASVESTIDDFVTGTFKKMAKKAKIIQISIDGKSVTIQVSIIPKNIAEIESVLSNQYPDYTFSVEAASPATSIGI